VMTNTGDLHYYGVVNRVSVVDAAGKLVGNASSTPLIRAIIPGQSVKFTVNVGIPSDPGTYNLTSRMEQQDGTLLDEKTASLVVQGAPAPSLTMAAPPASQSPSRVPGFTAVLGSAAAGISAALAIRRK